MHKNVDNQGPLLVIIKTKENYMFGGFISQGLDISISDYAKDGRAFIFSLTKGTVHYQRNKTNTIILHSDQYISFGHRLEGQYNWDDISLKYSCNVDYWSYSDFGWSFIPP